MRYAQNTSVSTDKSRQEIENTLLKYGADQFLYGWEGNLAFIRFRMNQRFITLRLSMPTSRDLDKTPSGRRRKENRIDAEVEQAKRQRWRALLLVVKAKLEAVQCGIASFEDEFLAYITLPSGETAGDWLRPQLALAYDKGVHPKMLPLPSGE